MSKRYDRASDDVVQHIRKLREKYYDYLEEVTVGAMFVSDEDGVPCLEHRGYPAAAVCRLVPSRDRAAGLSDVMIIIDRAVWQTYDAKQKAALVDHELYHIEPVIKDGVQKYDAQERPKCKIRKHDYQFGWFDEIANRHGEASCEVSQAKMLVEMSGQLYFNFSAAA
jgi:hypothetical protein